VVATENAVIHVGPLTRETALAKRLNDFVIALNEEGLRA